MERERLPIALTIAGSDSGGGAGIQADLKTFAALAVHGTSVITCLTAQNPKAVRATSAVPPEFVREQLEAVFEELRPQAIKTGMLFSAEIIRAVANFLASHKDIPLVVDPVLVATSGGRLMQEEAVEVLKEQLLPRAHLITPNVPEAEALAGRAIRSITEMRSVAAELSERFGGATLLKGGHLPQQRTVTDLLSLADGITELPSKFISGIRPHGTGCTLSAAIAAQLAKGEPLPAAVAHGKRYVEMSLSGGALAGGHFTLHIHRSPCL